MIDDPRAWETVLHRIEGDLLSGALRPGDHLPPERALAAELGVGRSSVREAVRVLEVMGLIRTGTGSGPNAGAIIVASPSGGMSALIRLHVAAKGFPVEDVVKTRLLLETTVADELARSVPEPGRSRESVLGEANQLLDAMDSPALTPSEFLALDAQFHVALADASGNQVIAAMMAGLRNSIEMYVNAAAALLPAWESTAMRLRAEHRGIVQAIALGDAARATASITDHISGYYAEAQLAPHAAENPVSPQEKEHR